MLNNKNKKWSDLKLRQREWIYIITREEFYRYIKNNGKKPYKKKKSEVINAVYNHITEREIWIPFGEADKAVGKYIDRLNRRTEFEIIDREIVIRKAEKTEISSNENTEI
jgi:hypothetical protein